MIGRIQCVCVYYCNYYIRQSNILGILKHTVCYLSKPPTQFFGYIVLHQPDRQYFLKAAVAVSNTLQLFLTLEKYKQEQNKGSL